jgi:hypothetical protein
VARRVVALRLGLLLLLLLEPIQFDLFLRETLHFIDLVIPAFLHLLNLIEHVLMMVSLLTLHICLETVVVFDVIEDSLHVLI